MKAQEKKLQIAATFLAGLVAQGMDYESAHKLALEKTDLAAKDGHDLTAAYESPRRGVRLTGWAEDQLDAVDAGVFSGDPYQAETGRARFKFYLDRWCREAYGVDLPAMIAAATESREMANKVFQMGDAAVRRALTDIYKRLGAAIAETKL